MGDQDFIDALSFDIRPRLLLAIYSMYDVVYACDLIDTLDNEHSLKLDITVFGRLMLGRIPLVVHRVYRVVQVRPLRMLEKKRLGIEYL